MLMPGLALIVWVLVFAAGLVGLAVGARLPDRHRTDESRSVVSVSMAMVGTLTALVLSLLLSTASMSFRSQDQLLMLISTNLMRTDGDTACIRARSYRCAGGVTPVRRS